jgi:hypothetical protein
VPERQRILELALKGLEAERAKIDGEIAQIRDQLGQRRVIIGGAGGTQTGGTATQPKKRRKMSAAARKRISESMKRRYAQMRAAIKK